MKTVGTLIHALGRLHVPTKFAVGSRHGSEPLEICAHVEHQVLAGPLPKQFSKNPSNFLAEASSGVPANAEIMAVARGNTCVCALWLCKGGSVLQNV